MELLEEPRTHGLAHEKYSKILVYFYFFKVAKRQKFALEQKNKWRLREGLMNNSTSVV